MEHKKRKTRRSKSDPCTTRSTVTRTIENTREFDQTIVKNLDPADQEELNLQFNVDEFHSYFDGSSEPKILITFFGNPCRRTRKFGVELTRVFANAIVMLRKRSTKEITKSAIRHGFTDIIIINENRRQPNALLLIHLPTGPTAYFKLSNVRLTKDIKRSHKEISSHRTELILTNFTTRLGITIGRLLGALFHHEPEFEGRKVATFHNQRDYIFFRHHKYEFVAGKRAKLRELGPRFTLKLRSLQEGTFDSKSGDYAWIITNKRHSLESRRRFFL